MDWENVLAIVVETICSLIVSVGIPVLVYYVKTKIGNDCVTSLFAHACQIVEKSVIMVDQIYVDALKKEGKFDKAAQEAALEMCKKNVLEMLDDEAKNAVISMCGCLETWLNVYIESCVRQNALKK